MENVTWFQFGHSGSFDAEHQAPPPNARTVPGVVGQGDGERDVAAVPPPVFGGAHPEPERQFRQAGDRHRRGERVGVDRGRVAVGRRQVPVRRVGVGEMLGGLRPPSRLRARGDGGIVVEFQRVRRRRPRHARRRETRAWSGRRTGRTAKRGTSPSDGTRARPRGPGRSRSSRRSRGNSRRSAASAVPPCGSGVHWSRHVSWSTICISSSRAPFRFARDVPRMTTGREMTRLLVRRPVGRSPSSSSWRRPA